MLVFLCRYKFISLYIAGQAKKLKTGNSILAGNSICSTASPTASTSPPGQVSQREEAVWHSQEGDATFFPFFFLLFQHRSAEEASSVEPQLDWAQVWLLCSSGNTKVLPLGASDAKPFFSTDPSRPLDPDCSSQANGQNLFSFRFLRKEDLSCHSADLGLFSLSLYIQARS